MNLPLFLHAVDKKKIMLLLLLALAGGAVGFVGGGYIAEHFSSSGAVNLPLAYKLSIIVWLPLALLLPLAIHELGHVVAGFLQGFTFKSYTVACFHFFKEDDQLKFKLVPNNLKGFAGLALCLPPGGLQKQELTKKFALYALGGPLINLLLTITLFVPYFLVWQHISKASPLAYTLADFAFITGIVSLLFFVTNIIPHKAGGFYTDGARVMNMWRGGDEAFLDSAVLSVMSNSLGGSAPEDLDEALLIEAAGLPVDSLFIHYCHSYLYLINLCRADIAQAKVHLEKYAVAVDNIPAIAQGSVWLEQAFFEALHGVNTGLAKEYYSKAAPSPFISKDIFLRAEAAIALKEGKYAEAKNLAEQGLEQLKNNLDQGAAKAYKVWLTQIYEEASFKAAGFAVA